MWWIIPVAVVVLVVLWYVSTYNSLIKLRNLMQEAFSGMDIYLKQRFDLVPNLVETVKGYAAHEKETLEAVISARNSALASSSGSISQQIEGAKAFDSALSRLLAVVEQYPQLKADTGFLQLQGKLSSLETDIAQSRKYYNGAARQYNDKIEKIPSNIVASMSGHKKVEYYEIAETSQREPVAVKF